MSGILNIGTRALQANQVALQTAGNNIANVNTPGYSRQSVVLQTVQGQYTGSGYVGKGVAVQTIQRNYNAFLNNQSTVAGSTQAADVARAEKLGQLEGLFEGGTTGLGAAINDMLNAFSDVASAPADLTARTVALTRIDETAARIRTTAQRLDDLHSDVALSLSQKVETINSLASSLARVNENVARAQGSGQPANDLLDQRDQLVRDLNQYIQTSSVAADDGTVNIFIGGSQPLVMGTSVSTVSLVRDDFGDTLTSKLAITRSGMTVTLDDSTLGGGEVSGLLRFQNTDLVEGRNLLGRLTIGVTESMNAQHQLGLDLDGNAGGNLFNTTSFSSKNVLPATANSGTATLSLSVSDPTQLEASNYEINFSSGTAGSITRKSDGSVTAFTFTPGTASPATAGSFAFYNPTTAAYDLSSINGLSLGEVSTGSPAAGDRFLLKPFSTSASDVQRAFSAPRALAVASPVAGSLGTANTGSLQLSALVARSNPVSTTPVTLTFTSAGRYTRSDELPTPNTTEYDYTAGDVIEGTTPATSPLSQWSATLTGVPSAGDTFTVGPQPASFRNLNAGNASALMDLRDVAMFDGAALSDGYAGLMAQLGVRAQSANFAAEVSSTVAGNLERDRSAVSGVNLDEEAAKLLQFQQAYQASAKMIQIAQGIFDTLIQSMGR